MLQPLAAKAGPLRLPPSPPVPAAFVVRPTPVRQGEAARVHPGRPPQKAGLLAQGASPRLLPPLLGLAAFSGWGRDWAPLPVASFLTARDAAGSPRAGRAA